MDILDTWSIKIAEEAAPDEVDLAPIMAQAFVKGGNARAELFKQETKGALGGFGAGQMVAIFPCILKGLAVAAPILAAVLSAASNITDIVSIAKDLVDLKKSLKKESPEAAADNPYAALKRAMDAVSMELKGRSMSQDQSDLIVFRVVKALLEDPAGATQFLRTIETAHA